METDKMSTASSVGAERRPLMQALVLERRILFACTVLVGLCTFVWITAVCTEKWVHIEGGNGVDLPAKGRYLMWAEAGVWEICRYVFQEEKTNVTTSNSTVKSNGVTELKGLYFTNGGQVQRQPQQQEQQRWRLHASSVSDGEHVQRRLQQPRQRRPKQRRRHESTNNSGWVPAGVRPHELTGGGSTQKCTNYLSQPIMENGRPLDPAYDVNIANYVRTMISFGIISLFVMAMGCGFSVYTFRNPRYMFKRLAAGIHFISTSCTFVVVQVMMSSVDYMKKSKTTSYVYPDRAYHYYHISFFMAWFVVLVNLFAAASFLWYSRKRKGDKAATDELAMADEPTIIGR